MRNGQARPFISIQGVFLHLEGRAPAKPINWEIRGDQHWAVIGPNGCGKSTLMKMLCGQNSPAPGRIIYHFIENGASANGSGQSALPHDHIAYVTFDAQRRILGHTPFHQARWNSGMAEGTLSVSDFLSERHVRQINPYLVVQERTDPLRFMALRERVIDLLSIGTLLERKMVQVSNGERRKVLLARALLRGPQLLILDNLFTGLDPGFRARLQDIIGSLMEEGPRFVVVGHERDEIPLAITHVLLMERNGVLVQGPRETILGTSPLPHEVTEKTGQQTSPPSHQATAGPAGGSTDHVLIHLSGVNVSYDSVHVLQGIDWTVRSGEKWAVVGPNGAGKTTLLSLILGDNPQAYANDVTLFGKRRGSGESIWQIKRQIGWVAPELHLYYPKGVSCLEVVLSGSFDSIGHHRRTSAQQRRTAMWWLEHLGLRQNAHRIFQEISEGEQRMMLIARALVKHPALLVLDEPCQGLDATNRDRVLQAVENVGSGSDVTLIYVTHHRDALPKLITHVLRLDEGKVVQHSRVMDRARAWRF